MPLPPPAGNERIDAALLEASFQRTHEVLESSHSDLYKWQGGVVAFTSHVIHVLDRHTVCKLSSRVFVCSAPESAAGAISEEGDYVAYSFATSSIQVPQMRQNGWPHH